jgi:pyruvate formate lyase activating enzyme
VLSESKVPFVIRVPLVPVVTDTDENLEAIAKIARNLPGLIQVELLPYNLAAGAKYAAVGRQFLPDYDESKAVNANVKPFYEMGVKVKVT